MTVWPATRPSRISTLDASLKPVLIATRRAFPSATTKTEAWSFPGTTAEAGTTRTSGFVSMAIRTRAYMPGRRSLAGFAISASAVIVLESSSRA